MNGLLAGLGMLGASVLATKRGPHLDIHLARTGKTWTAWLTGEEIFYLPPYQRQATGRSGWEALQRLAELWKRAGFTD